MRVEQYLSHIGLTSEITPCIDSLTILHRHHLTSVPFENLDVIRGRPIVLDIPALHDKIVIRKRGGFCYELNALFAWLLGEVGFDVQLVGAAVARENGEFGRDLAHMALLVHLEQELLVDVGFGDSFMEPIATAGQAVHLEGRASYRVVESGDDLLALERTFEGENWKPQYRYSTKPRQLSEFNEMCHFTQSSPESSFTRGSICSIALANGGRVSLSDSTLTFTDRHGNKSTQPVGSKREFADFLAKDFGLTVGEVEWVEGIR